MGIDLPVTTLPICSSEFAEKGNGLRAANPGLMKPVKLALLGALVLMLPGLKADAANAYVSVYNNYFAVTPIEAVAGDAVTWSWTCSDGSYYSNPSCVDHRIVATSGAVFDSGVKSAQGSTFTYNLTQTQEISYRCTLHSSLNGSACNGMCGKIVADAKPPVPRIIQSPPNSVSIGNAVYSGDVNDNRGVASIWMRFTNAFTGAVIDELATAPLPSGPGLVSWTFSASIPSGLYSVKAMARDIYGLVGSSAPLTLIKI